MEKRQINNTANQDDNTLGNEKIVRRHKVVNTWSYKIMDRIAKIMDHYYLDPLLGLVPGGWGDLISSIMVLPFVWFSLCVVKSIPLTLAVIYNAMLDAVKGLLPFFVGDVLDVFNHSYVRNMRLVQGFVYDDQDVVREVKRKAWFLPPPSCFSLCSSCCLLSSLSISLAFCSNSLVGDENAIDSWRQRVRRC